MWKNTRTGDNLPLSRFLSLSISLSSGTRTLNSVALQSRFVIAMTEIYSRSDRDYDFRDSTTRQVGDGAVVERRRNEIKSNIRGELRLQLLSFSPPHHPTQCFEGLFWPSLGCEGVAMKEIIKPSRNFLLAKISIVRLHDFLRYHQTSCIIWREKKKKGASELLPETSGGGGSGPLLGRLESDRQGCGTRLTLRCCGA